MTDFDPSKEGVDDVLAYLKDADSSERQRVLVAETQGKKRKSVLREYDVDENARYDAAGRPLYAHEVAPDEQVFASPVDESDEEREAREAQAEQDAATASEQGGSDAPGTGVAPSLAGGAGDLG